jgi:hypothetical protein
LTLVSRDCNDSETDKCAQSASLLFMLQRPLDSWECLLKQAVRADC